MLDVWHLFLQNHNKSKYLDLVCQLAFAHQVKTPWFWDKRVVLTRCLFCEQVEEGVKELSRPQGLCMY